MICWTCRQSVTHACETDAPLSKWARRHLQACPECEGFYQLQQSLARRLKAEAPLHTEAPSPFLTAKISSSLEGRTANRRRGQKVPQYVAGWIAIAGVASALVLAGYLFWPARPATDMASAPYQPSARFSETFSIPASWPDREQFYRWTDNVESPLENEIQSIVQDTRTAAHALAQNFLPKIGP